MPETKFQSCSSSGSDYERSCHKFDNIPPGTVVMKAKRSVFYPDLCPKKTLLCLAASLLLTVSSSSASISGSGHGRLHTQDKKGETPVCGSTNPNNNVLDLLEPESPGPFRDLTTEELRQLRTFLENDPNIRAVDPEKASMNSSYIYTADLLVPRKSEVLQFLDKNGPQPIRKARVVVFRGDKDPALVEEYACWPLPEVKQCELLNLPPRRNPVEFNFRPLSDLEYNTLVEYVLSEVDRQVGHILKESYGATFTTCKRKDECLNFMPSPHGSEILGNTNRLTWVIAAYNLPFRSVHVLDFAVLADSSDSNPAKWFVDRIWYAGQVFFTFDDLIDAYDNNRINKTRVKKPSNDRNLFSSLQQRGDYLPPNPQRPPTFVEPDGKRYSVKDRQVEYLGWTFNFRSSSLTGPAVYDVRYKGKRIVYELALSEIAVLYSAYSPYGQTTDYVDSGCLLGVWSRSLVPGGDCPDTASHISSAFMSQTKRDPDVFKYGFCLFEINNGYPLRRHLEYDSYYGGMLDSALTLRSALTIGNYDYIIDFIFHPNAVIETRLMSTGYIQGLVYSKLERPYGFQIQDKFLGNVHHHLVNFKADLDIEGTSNRYETLDISQEQVPLTAFPEVKYSQIRYETKLKSSELEAVVDYDFNKPKYHVVRNVAARTEFNEVRGYRIQMNGMSKNLVAEGQGNEKTFSWARHQMVVTKHKDDEISSSSIYGMYDSFRPVVDFSSYYKDNETIVDEDLVFWITNGLYHIPHTEDLPVTPTVGNHLTFFLLPYNYFPECPSMGSRDAIYVDHIDHEDPKKGVKVERNGNSRDQCVLPRPSLEEDVAQDPNVVLASG